VNTSPAKQNNVERYTFYKGLSDVGDSIDQQFISRSGQVLF